jgi:hypothetical protein
MNDCVELNETHQLLVCAGDNILSENLNTIRKTTASRDFGLEVNREKTKFMVVSCH